MTIKQITKPFLAGVMALTFMLPASALEYRYDADLYDNTFYSPTSSNDAIAIDSKDDSGGATIVVKSPSMGGSGGTAALNGSPSIPVGSFVDPWGTSIETLIDTDTKLNGLEGLAFNREETSGAQFTGRGELHVTNGHFGSISIGNRNIFANVYAGASSSSMRKGAGHITDTSAWNGNVALCGHNRGSWAFFGNLKNVQVGDAVTYKTSMGTRVYRVTAANKILATDTSVLNATPDNRLTLITCIANEPSYRLCVIAQEIKMPDIPY